MSTLDVSRATSLVDKSFADTIVPTLVEYVSIPNKSPAFDPQWREHGHMDKAVALVERWCKAHALPKMTIEVIRLEGRTPLIYMEAPGDVDDTVLLYGHLDKQPEMTGWSEGLGPWSPVLRDDRLYGRGGTDDGYAAFASLSALRILADQKIPRARCVLLIEACEESGSVDLPAYIEALAPRIGKPSLVVCLDSGCGTYDRLWCTTSLRGLASGTLEVDILTEGVHSGDASGIVPSSFRIARQVLSRLEDETTGRVLLPELHVAIPPDREAQARVVAEALGDDVYAKFPFVPGAKPMGGDRTELVLNRTWRPTLSVVAAEGLPALKDGGNVLRPRTALKLSVRLPPGADPDKSLAAIKRAVERDAPYGAKVAFSGFEGSSGWNAPPMAPWLEQSLAVSSKAYFGRETAYMGEGGTIPFMAMLGARFPGAQFVITGVLGPGSNAHGPNEFLDVPMAKGISAAVAHVLDAHARR